MAERAAGRRSAWALSGLLLSTGLLVGIFAGTPARAQSGELTQRDRTAALYSTQFTFGADHVPVVNVALMDDQEEVSFSSESPLRILPGGEGGSEILTPKGLRWTARIEHGTPASVRYWVVVDRLPARDLAALRVAKERLADKGAKIRTFEVGSLFSFFGQVMDSRAVLFALDEPHADYAEAKAAAEKAGAAYNFEAFVHAQLDKRSSGTVVFTNNRGTMTIRNSDVLWVVPQDPSATIRVRRVEYGRHTSWHGYEDRSYRGKLYIAVDRRGRLAVVNSVDAETLLRGIVPSEIYPSSPMAALQAQAIVARGELLAKIGTRHLADPYLLCAEVHCQAYSGVKKETARTDRAIAETHGRMLFDGDGLVDSVYSASCGGYTEHNDLAWPGSPANPSLRGVFDGARRPAWIPTEGLTTDALARRFLTEDVGGWCGRTRKGRSSYRWAKALPASKVSALVAKRYPDVGDITDLVSKRRGASGRIVSLELRGTRGVVVVERELTIRRLLGGLKSSLFVVDVDRDAAGSATSFRFTGGGFGHGVGMCQTGAIGMAESGLSDEQILSHYYQGASIKKVY